MKKSTLLHLRIPFSFFLMPVFLFSWSTAPDVEIYDFIAVFFILHLFLYPASNGYNSYFDKDEDSIGGLKQPPKVEKELYYYAILFDIIAIIWGITVNLYFAVFLFIYGLVSKAYSHPAIRLKKMPYIGWIAAGFFQGYFTFLTVYIGLHGADWSIILSAPIQIAAILSTLILFGSYPMTQIYQHAEDSRRGDLTISRILGILGTFHFTAIAFLISSIGFFIYYNLYVGIVDAIIFYITLTPVLLFFAGWYLRTRKDLSEANFEGTMRLNMLSSLCLNLFFLYEALFGGYFNIFALTFA